MSIVICILLETCRVGGRGRPVYDECVEVEAKLADVRVGATHA